MKIYFRPILLVVAAATVLAAPDPAMANDVVKRWLGTNSGVNSVKINFTQTRTMRSLKVPIRQSGTLWLDYRSGRFRWQTGNPAQTIVVKPASHLFILRTPMKKYEKRPAGAGGAPGMGALASGFPRSYSDFQRKYRLQKVEPRHNTHRIVATPLGAGGRGVNTFTFVVDQRSYKLVGIEIDLKDGSSVKTVFNGVQTNAAVPLSLFQPDLTGYKEVKF